MLLLLHQLPCLWLTLTRHGRARGKQGGASAEACKTAKSSAKLLNLMDSPTHRGRRLAWMPSARFGHLEAWCTRKFLDSARI